MNCYSFSFQSILLIIVIIISASCSKSKVEVVEEIASPVKPQIEGFYFFDRNLSLKQVENLLKSKGINFKKIKHDNSDEIITPGGFHIRELIKTNRIQLLGINNFNLLGYTLDHIQLGFYNSKIFYLEFLEINGRGELFPIRMYQNPKVYKEDEINLLEVKAKENLNFMRDLKEGLEQKYGSPTSETGDVYKAFEYLRPYDDTRNGFSRELNEHPFGWVYWDSPATNMKISLFRNYSIELAPNRLKYELFLEGFSVIFDMEIEKMLIKEAQLELDKEKKLKEFKQDSLKTLKQMRIDSV